MKKRCREIKALVVKAGLALEALVCTGGGHYCATVRNAANIVRNFIFSATPGDVRGDHNKAALLRRFAASTEAETRARK